jgi:hypothetical protein
VFSEANKFELIRVESEFRVKAEESLPVCPNPLTSKMLIFLSKAAPTHLLFAVLLTLWRLPPSEPKGVRPRVIRTAIEVKQSSQLLSPHSQDDTCVTKTTSVKSV